MVRRTVILPMIFACLLAATTWRSQAAFTIGDWIATPSQTVGVATWDLTATTLPASLGVTFADITLPTAKLEIQNEDGLLTHAASYSLDYTVSLSGGWYFTGVGVDSTTFGHSDVSKDVTWPSGSLSASAVDGTPSGIMPIAGGPTSLTVHETITVGSDSVVTAFANSYTAVVPEPGTILAGAMLLLPFGVSAFRLVRRS